jgi:4-carboxymuconolactone decarboxylase
MLLSELLSRPDLPRNDRLLVAGIAAIWRGDWACFRQTADAARATGLPRTEVAEMLLQAVLFCGFPRAITAFGELAAVWPATAPEQGGGLPPTAQAAAGRELFAAIYGKHDQTVRTMLQSYHGELHDFVLEAAYGRILARPALGPKRREWLAVGALAAMDQPRQFVPHARGARHFGSTLAELREVLITALADTAAADRWLQLLEPR